LADRNAVLTGRERALYPQNMRGMLFALGVLVALAGCRQLFGFDDPKPRTDAGLNGDGHPDASPCTTQGLTCSGQAMAVTCNGCWVSCPDLVTEPMAKSRCQAWGGHLATLSEGANCLRTSVPTGDLWIGLEQMTGATSPAMGWAWIGGGAVFNANWDTGQPDDDNGGTEIGKAQCAYVKNGGSAWSDTPCNSTYEIVCNRDTGN
jgi:hypothetical protein